MGAELVVKLLSMVVLMLGVAVIGAVFLVLVSRVNDEAPEPVNDEHEDVEVRHG